MNFSSFLRENVIAGIALFVGPLVFVGSLVLHAYAIHDMGLPLEIWVAIGLAIFSVGTVGILYRGWINHLIPIGGISTPETESADERLSPAPQSEARDLRGERYRSLAPSDTFEVVQARPEMPEDESKIIWKRKLRVVLRNRSGRHVEVRAPDWVCSIGYVAFQSHPAPHFWSILQDEDVAAGGWMHGQWNRRETDLLSIAPNGVFRASIGLDPLYSVDDIRNRLLTRRVGMLVLPVKTGDQEMEWRVRL
jgi:hypothetical protein